MSGFYDSSVDELSLTFSEAVEWSVLSAGQFTAHGGLGSTATNPLGGPDGPGTGFTLSMTGGPLIGPTGTLDYAAVGNQITSTATGLPLLAFTGFPILIGV